MLRIILALLATLVVCASPLTARASSVVDAERAATVYITINDSGHGTGFAIASRGGLTTILTAKHVVVGAASLTVTDALGDTHEVVGAPTLDPAHDVASIQVRGQMPTVRVATFESSPADPVVQHVQVIGNPGNEVSLLSPAFVLYHYGADDPVMPGDYAIQCETCSYGDSGAAGVRRRRRRVRRGLRCQARQRQGVVALLRRAAEHDHRRRPRRS